MIPPVLWLGAVVLLWGWSTELLWMALPLGLLLEAAPWVRRRWPLEDSEWRAVWRLCLLLFIGLAVGVASTATLATGVQAVQRFFMWLPVCYAPLIVAQQYSTAGRVDFGLLSLLARRRVRGQEPIPRPVTLTYPFALLCVLAACAGNPRTSLFYPSLLLLAAWALWPLHPREGWGRWALSLLLAGVIGYAGQYGLQSAQQLMEARVLMWLTGRGATHAQTTRAHTAIGSIAARKQSDQIIFRVADTPGVQGMLLREGSYNLYESSPTSGDASWYATSNESKEWVPEPDGRTWVLDPGRHGTKTIRIALPFQSHSVLPIPSGTVQLAELSVSGLTSTRLGSVMGEEGPGLLTYRVTAIDGEHLAAPPDRVDLSIPPSEAQVIATTAHALGLRGRPVQDVLATITQFFRDEFRYAESQGATGAPGVTELSHFLTTSRAGHCEYFATATVLLLRAAGVPARYAVGFAVQERSGWGEWYVVRGHHAHAWAQAYLDGTWRDVDTTPGTWTVLDAGQPSWRRKVGDAWAWLMFLIARWRMGEYREVTGIVLIALLCVAVLGVLWQLRGRRRAVSRETTDANKTWPGQDSAFYRIEARLRADGYPREPGESLVHWGRRMERQSSFQRLPSLTPLLALHYRYRFHPAGFSEEARGQLVAQCRRWLNQYERTARRRG